MKKIQKNAARFDNLKQDFLDDKKVFWHSRSHVERLSV
jgi:hypothetical protein